MNKVIISLEEYNSLKEKAEKWDNSQFSPKLAVEKIKEDIERLYCTRYHRDLEIIKTKIYNIILNLYNKSSLGYVPRDWVKQRLNAVLDDLK